MPKSGTEYLMIFFVLYKKLLIKQDIVLTDYFPMCSFPVEFNNTRLLFNHDACPGFYNPEVQAELDPRWSKLEYGDLMPWTKWFNSTAEELHILRNASTLQLQDIRSVFVYRNPLDQLVSHFKHSNSFPADIDLSAADYEKFNDLPNFIFHERALDSYIKLYLTFEYMKNKHQNLLFITYEELSTNPEITLKAIMQHLNIPYDESAFQDAVNLSSKTNMIALEKKLNHSLQAINNETLHIARHVRNGGIGVWQKFLTPEIVSKIADRLQEFGISLHTFTLAEHLEEKFAFVVKKTRYRM